MARYSGGKNLAGIIHEAALKGRGFQPRRHEQKKQSGFSRWGEPSGRG